MVAVKNDGDLHGQRLRQSDALNLGTAIQFSPVLQLTRHSSFGSVDADSTLSIPAHRSQGR